MDGAAPVEYTILLCTLLVAMIAMTAAAAAG